MNRRERRDQVRGWLDRRERLGLTYAELVAEAGLSAGAISQWAWRLRRESQGRRGKEETPPGFVELVATPASTEGRLEIVLTGGRRLIVVGGVEDGVLVHTIRALEQC